MNPSTKVTLDYQLYILSPIQMDNLAAEFYGRPLDFAGYNSDQAQYGYYEFDTAENATAFQNTLNSGFRKEP